MGTQRGLGVLDGWVWGQSEVTKRTNACLYIKQFRNRNMRGVVVAIEHRDPCWLTVNASLIASAIAWPTGPGERRDFPNPLGKRLPWEALRWRRRMIYLYIDPPIAAGSLEGTC